MLKAIPNRIADRSYHKMILEKLKTVDPNIHGMASTDGIVWLSPGLQGRIFCSIGDELTHKLDFDLASNPTDGFNNIGASQRQLDSYRNEPVWFRP